MIAITKEFRQILKEVFDSRGITEIPADDLADILNIDLKELKTLITDESIRNEYIIIQAKDNTLFVKRTLEGKLEGKVLISAFKIQWDNIGGCPCFTCYELDKCDIGNPISSVDCPLFTRWLFTEPQKEQQE
ncbi:MAG: hypothetical protein JXA54_04445 [Candidatus Heimdallarchaeota archaeon]|nr:hypothetical protein [Candidatus Heimdallarchaeota archaeon]